MIHMKEKILGMVKSTAGAVLIVTILMTVIVQLLTGHFYTAYNLSTFSRSASFTIIIGFAQTLVLLLGGIDLSVASVAGLCSMIFAMLTTVGGSKSFFVYCHSAYGWSCFRGN